MPELTTQDATRTRKVKTIIDTVEPIVEKSETGLGMTPLEYVRQLADEQLPLCKLYIYRVDPKTTGSYIDLVSDRVDEQILEERYGGKILAVKLQHKTADGLKEGYQSRIEVLSEPKYTKRELFANPSLAPAPAATPVNSSGGISEAMLSRLIDKLLEEKLSTQNANASAIESTVKMMENASTRAVDVVAAQVAKNGNSLLETITVLKELGLLGQKPEASGIRETLSLLKELGIVGGEKTQAKTLVDQLKDLTALKEFFGGEDAGGKGSGKTNIYDVLSAITDKGPQILDKVMFMANENIRRKQAAAARQGIAAAEALPPAVTTERPVEVAAPENAAPVATTGVDPDEPFKKLVVKRIQENSDPVIVLNLIEAWNPQVAAMLHAFNREAVRGFIQADSILKEALNAPEFEKWFAAFYELIEEDNRDVDEGAEPGSKRVQ